jgi:hypothetical protein
MGVELGVETHQNDKDGGEAVLVAFASERFTGRG